MAAVTLGGAIKISLARFRISRNHVLNLISEPGGCLLRLVMKKCGDICNLRLVHGEFRHAFLRAALQNHWTDLVAFFVMQYQHRANQIRSTLSAGPAAAVTEGAVGN